MPKSIEKLEDLLERRGNLQIPTKRRDAFSRKHDSSTLRYEAGWKKLDLQNTLLMTIEKTSGQVLEAKESMSYDYLFPVLL